MKLKYFSLFAGIGGLEYGLWKSGNECVGFSEVKESSIKIYNKNFGNVKNYGDITKIDIKSLPEFDILLGGFPCQSFSLAGLRKGFDDQRGKMIFYIYNILKIKQPKYVVLENVKGLVNHNGGKTYNDVFKLLTNCGYFVRVLLLNSMFYGSAQGRERLFFLCSKDKFDLKIPKIIDDTKRFRDIRENNGVYKLINLSDRNVKKIEQKNGRFNFELIGGYDRVGTLTTQYGCGEKVVQEKDGSFRYLTVLECERLQGFSDGWTDVGLNNVKRYWALGNAVNCNVSDYLFNDYLKDLWFNK